MFSTNSSLNRLECTAAKRNPAVTILILSPLLCLRVYATFMARHLGWTVEVGKICEVGHVKVKNTVLWQYNTLNNKFRLNCLERQTLADMRLPWLFGSQGSFCVLLSAKLDISELSPKRVFLYYLRLRF